MEYMLLYMFSAIIEVITAYALGYRNNMLMWAIVLINIPSAFFLKLIVSNINLITITFCMIGIIIELGILYILFLKKYTIKELLIIVFIGNTITYIFTYFITPLFSL